MVFPLAAIGAGFGQFAQDYRQQQEQQRQTLMLQMQLANWQREFAKDQREAEAAGMTSGFGSAGAGQQPAPTKLPQYTAGYAQPTGGAPGGSAALTGSVPGAGASPAADGTPGAGSFGEYGGNQSGLSVLRSLAHQVAPSVLPQGFTLVETSGFRPGARVAGTGGVSQHGLEGPGRGALDLQIVGPDGVPIPNTGEDTTGHYGRLALAMRAAAPPDIASVMGWGGNFTTGPANGPRDLMHFDLGGDRGRYGTLAQMAGAQAAPGAQAGAAQTPPVAASTTPGQGAALAGNLTASLTGTGAVPPGGTQVAQAGAPATPPPQPPKLPKSREVILQELKTQYPNSDPQARNKAAANIERDELEKYKVRLQEHQAQMDLYKLGPLHQQQRGERIQDATTQAEQLAKVPARKGQENITLENGVTITGFPATGKWTTLTGEPLTPEMRKMLSEGRVQTLGAYGAGRKAEQIELTDPATGKVVFEGLAHETSQNKWTSAADGRVLDTAGLKLTRQPPSIGVTSQNVGNRISYASNEVSRAVENMTKMPIGTTLGWFGGAQSLAPRDLRAGLTRNLANAVTPESAQMLAAMARGIERGLGIMASVGAATGLVTLTESMKGEIPQQNDTGFVILTKYANMRQLVEAANDTIQASNLVPETQKKQMQVNTDRIIKAVPWTVADVIELKVKPTDQSVADFAKKLGLGQKQEGGAGGPAGAPLGAPAGGAQAGPPPEAIADLKRDPSPTRRLQFDQIFGQGAADRAVGAARARTPMPPPSGPVFTAPIPPAQ